MLLFSDCKINLGLYVTARRPDGYHEVETVMYPIDWHDVVEGIRTSDTAGYTLEIYGREVDCPMEKNLVSKAHRAMEMHLGRELPCRIGLQKIIPDGAGLGGGSADAAYTLRLLNQLFELGLSQETLASIAAGIGADCPFFIYDKPALCTGIGTDLDHDISVDLAPYSILVAKPRVAAVSTREAYASITPQSGRQPLREILALPVGQWKGLLVNDFENGIFEKLPRVKELKETMYEAGAIYASMSGSGAAVYGLFNDDKMARELADSLTDCDWHISSARAK